MFRSAASSGSTEGVNASGSSGGANLAAMYASNSRLGICGYTSWITGRAVSGSSSTKVCTSNVLPTSAGTCHHGGTPTIFHRVAELKLRSLMRFGREVEWRGSAWFERLLFELPVVEIHVQLARRLGTSCDNS